MSTLCKWLCVCLLCAVWPVQATDNNQYCDEEVPRTLVEGRFVSHEDDTVTDTQSGLMWQRCALGRSGEDCATGTSTAYNWQQALAAAESATFASYDDWRLPNATELHMLVEHRCIEPATDSAIFPNTLVQQDFFLIGEYWSATPYAYNYAGAWVVDFTYGALRQRGKSDEKFVHLVRKP